MDSVSVGGQKEVSRSCCFRVGELRSLAAAESVLSLVSAVIPRHR
jgi:hypothetical protein